MLNKARPDSTSRAVEELNSGFFCLPLDSKMRYFSLLQQSALFFAIVIVFLSPQGHATTYVRPSSPPRYRFYKPECSPCNRDDECRTRKCLSGKCQFSIGRCFKKPACADCVFDQECLTNKCWGRKCVYDDAHFSKCVHKPGDDDKGSY